MLGGAEMSTVFSCAVERKKTMSKKDDTQRKLVENYLQEHRLESILNSVINQCVKDRPQDPFVMMATLLKEHSSSKIGILSVIGREVLDCRGVPTVEATVVTQQGSFTASVPVGPGPSDAGGVASVHLKDGDEQRYGGKGVLQAVKNVNELIAPVLIGMVPQDQSKIDAALVDLDGTGNMAKVGANATLAVSMACARAGAMEKGVSLYRHLADLADMRDVCLPVPSFGLISGGRQAGNKLAFREFGVMPVGLSSLKDAVRCGAEIYAKLVSAIREEFGWAAADACGTEGGLCPDIETADQAVDLIVKAIIAAGYTTEDVKIAIGISAHAFVVKKEAAAENEDAEAEAAALEAEAAAAAAAEKDGEEDDEDEVGAEGSVADAPVQNYNLQFKSAAVDAKETQIIDGDSLREEYRALCEKYPDIIVSLEDPFDRSDTSSFKRLTEELGENIQVVGDRLLSGHGPSILSAQTGSLCNAIVVRPSDAGTVSDAIRTCKLGQEAGWGVIVSHNTGDTEDTFISDLVVGLSSGQLRSGAPGRSERTAKLNRLLRIEEECDLAGTDAPYAGRRYRFPVA